MIAALEAQLGRKLLVAAMDPGRIELKRRAIGALHGRERESDDVVKSRAHAEEKAAEAAQGAVRPAGGIPFAILDFIGGLDQLGAGENQIGDAAAQLARRAV